MGPPPRRAARRVIVAGAATLLGAAVMAIAGSGAPPADERSPYATAVVALELVRSPAEVFAALGTGDTREILVRVVSIDFVFMLLYPLLQVAVVAFLTRRRPWRVLAAALAIAMVAGDALENRAMLGLLALPAADAPGAAALVAGVALWTTVKWSALFAAALVDAVLLWSAGGVPRVLAAVPLATAVAGVVGLASGPHRQLVEVAGVPGMGATWAVVLGMALVAFSRRKGKAA